MNSKCSELAGKCACGRAHAMTTRFVTIEPGALAHFEELTADLPKRRTAVYDENTYAAAAGRRPAADRELILSPEKLHADENAVEKALSGIGEPEILIAVGSGTVHDIVRYCAAQRKIPFISVPTAASVDGFCSNVAAMTWYGYKKTVPAVAPVCVIADTDILVKAPIRLALSGAGDIFGKYISLADWKMAHLLTDEYYCERIASMMSEAVEAVYACCRKLRDGDAEAFEKLTYALMLSGLAMQMIGNSRPASGAEHHISHLLELGLPMFGECHTLHGERVGVGTLLASAEYHRIAACRPKASADKPMPTEALEQAFAALTPSMLEENHTDCLSAVAPETVNARMEALVQILKEIPTAETLCDLYRETGLPVSLEDIGVDENLRDDILRLSPYVRNRLTLMRMRRLFDIV